MMRIHQQSLSFATRGRGFVEISDEVVAVVRASAVATGLCHVFLRHTSASVCITENAAPEVRADLERWIADAAPDGDPRFRHDEEGPDDMPAHVRSLLGGHELTIPIREGRLALGTWQGIYLWEHRLRAHRRELVVTVQGAEAC